MSVPTNPAGAPRTALWLLNLCAGSEAADAMVGDLLEDYSLAAARCSRASANAWFWRETWRTVPHLLVAGFRSAPWVTVAALIAGYLLRRITFRLPERLVVSILDRYRVCDTHFSACLFWLSDGVVVGLIILSAIIAALLALASRGREMTITVALAAFQLVWTLAGAILAMALMPHYWPNWTLLHEVAFSIAILGSGALVRTWRLRHHARVPG
jgi:hypothetical protein